MILKFYANLLFNKFNQFFYSQFQITGLLDTLGTNANTEATYLTVDQQTGAEILSAVQRSGLPLVFINGDCIGGISDFRRLYQSGFLGEALKPHDYDLIVLGGGSGGVSAAMVRIF